MMKKISIIVPSYNEEESIPLFYKEIDKVSKNMNVDFEFIFVNDGSRDKTLDIVKNLSKEDKRVKYIDFSRNFGKESAMYAGLELSSGDFVAIMDADLQDPPTLLPKMLKLIEEDGYDCVGTRRVTRKGEPKIRSFFARIFYKIINKMSKTEMVDGARDYRLMTRQMVNSILDLKEYNRYSKGLFSFVGYKTKYLEYENIERVAGETKWSFWKLFIYAVEGIVAFSTMPLFISMLMGILFILASLVLLIISIFNASSLFIIICIMFFVGGIILIATGINALYLSKTYTEIKSRPIYIIKETNVKKNEKN